MWWPKEEESHDRHPHVRLAELTAFPAPDQVARRLFALALTAAGLLGITAAPAHAVTVSRDRTSGHTTPASAVTCQGKGIDPTAKLHHRTEAFVKAPLSTIGKL
ncbi:hypothetical protein ACH427_32145 [Streptomyces sp. NPDC020379]|uniref:hypothetical protein n=1 Tax=Streptomyces sp. NPDC020379 TaxID=3365071 RepID=UPI0037B38FCA